MAPGSAQPGDRPGQLSQVTVRARRTPARTGPAIIGPMNLRRLAALAAALLLTGCTSTSPPPPTFHNSSSQVARPTSTAAGSSSPGATSSPAASTSAPPSPTPTGTQNPGGALFDATGHGWRPTGTCQVPGGATLHAPCLDGPRYTPDHCHDRTAGGGQPLPDPACTPGAIDGNVTQSNLGSTICVRGYTATIRPPQSVTGPAKSESATEYGFTGTGEYDHLVPLELGGASDTRNLWVQPGPIPNPKDQVEGALRALVCGSPTSYVPSAKRLPLADAQRLIATDWTTAIAQAQPLIH